MTEIQLRERRRQLLARLYGNVQAGTKAMHTRRFPLPIPQLYESVAGPRSGTVWLYFGDYTANAEKKLTDAVVSQWIPWSVTSNDAVYTARQGQFITITARWPEELWTTAVPFPDLALDSHQELIRLGVNDSGNQVNIQLDSTKPHALIGGTTGGGKTETLKTILANVARFKDWQVVLLSGKGIVDLVDVQHLNNYRYPVATTPQEVAGSLQAVTNELQARYDNPQLITNSILVIFDEPQEFTAEFPEIAALLGKLLRLGRSVKVHVVLATQEPRQALFSDPTIQGQGRAGYTIALRTADAARSRLVVGDSNPRADALTGRGDAWVLSQTSGFHRTQVYLVAADYFKKFAGPPVYAAIPQFDGERLAGAEGHTAMCYSPTELGLALRAASLHLNRNDTGALLRDNGVGIANDRLGGLRDFVTEMLAAKGDNNK